MVWLEREGGREGEVVERRKYGVGLKMHRALTRACHVMRLVDDDDAVLEHGWCHVVDSRIEEVWLQSGEEGEISGNGSRIDARQRGVVRWVRGQAADTRR